VSERRESFEVAGPVPIIVTNPSGDVIVGPADGDIVTVLLSGDDDAVEGTTVDGSAAAVSVCVNENHRRRFAKRVDVLISVPPGGVLRARLGSGDITVQLPMRTVEVNTASGDVRVDQSVAELRVKAASGDISIDGVVSEAAISSASGGVRISKVDNIVVKTASGSVGLGTVTSAASVKSASGDVKLQDFSGSDLDIKTMSGDVTIGLVPGLEIDATITVASGEFENRIEPSGVEPVGGARLSIKSFSGDVALRSSW
jgi:hypothetical protein